MMATEREKILDRLRKLQAMADAAGTTEAEAQAFAAKVQEMLTAYKLSAADIPSEQKVEEPIDRSFVTWQTLGLKERRVRVDWAERMAAFISRAYYCEFIISGSMRYDRSIGYIIGAETDRQVAVYMFVTLARFLDKLAEEEMHKFWVANNVNGQLPEHLHGFKQGFMTGFVTRLRERFDEEVQGKSPEQTTAIVHVRKDALAKTKNWITTNMSTKKISGLSANFGNPAGQAAGKKAANNVDLNSRGIDRTGKDTRRLS